jgi:Ca2+-binding EF-hand superfamily protein
MKKNFLNFALGSIAVSVFSLSAPVYADTSPEDANRFVKMYDSNKDGMVSKAELMKRAEEMLAKMPKDKAGMMDDKKAMAFLLELQKSDGGLGRMMSKEDIMKKVGAAFDKMDTSKKGMLNAKQAEQFLIELMKSGA